MILFPMMAAIIFNLAIGGDFRNIKIVIQNQEITDCQNHIVNECFYDDNTSLSLSCDVLTGLRTLEYNLVKILINIYFEILCLVN